METKDIEVVKNFFNVSEAEAKILIERGLNVNYIIHSSLSIVDKSLEKIKEKCKNKFAA